MSFMCGSPDGRPADRRKDGAWDHLLHLKLFVAQRPLHPAMRERYLSAFDRITIDKPKWGQVQDGKVTPMGCPILAFSLTESNPDGIGLGTVIALLVRKPNHAGKGAVFFRESLGNAEARALLQDAEGDSASYITVTPRIELRFPFAPVVVSQGISPG